MKMHAITTYYISNNHLQRLSGIVYKNKLETQSRVYWIMEESSPVNSTVDTAFAKWQL